LDGGDGGTSSASLRPTAASADFGSVEVGKSGMATTITIRNEGSMASGAPMVAVTSGASEFTISNNGCQAAVSGNGMCTVQLVFKPSMSGARTGTLSISATPGGSASVALSGNGAVPGSLEITPQSHDFTATAVGSTSAATAFTVKNPGTTMVAGVTVSVNGADFVIVDADNKCNNVALAAGGTCTVGVAFKPGSSGDKTGTLLATGTGVPMGSAGLRGKANDPAKLSAQPTVANIAGDVGASSPAFAVSVANTGDVASGVPTVMVSGTDANQFTASGCQVAVAPNALCTVNVVFKPTSAGTKNATLTVSAMPGGMTTVMLVGTAIVPGTVTIDPKSNDYGVVAVGSADRRQHRGRRGRCQPGVRGLGSQHGRRRFGRPHGHGHRH